MARWAVALPRLCAVLLLLSLGFTNALQVIEKRKPAPIPTRHTVPLIPASSNVKKAVLSLREGSDAGSPERRALNKDITNVFYSKLSYNVLVKLGEIEFLLALDTGSSDIWVITDQCQTQQCRGVPVYPAKSFKSPSFIPVNGNQTAFNISFADTTSANGFIAKETFTIGGIQAAGQAIGMVTQTNLTLGASVSGVLGMGFPRLSRIAGSIPNAPPFLNALSQLGQIEYPLFGLSVTYDLKGTLSMGAIDNTVVTNTSLISWHDVVPFLPLPGDNVTDTSLYLQWAIPLAGIAINGTQADIKYTEIPLHATFANLTGEQPLSLLDVGYNGIFGPFEDVKIIIDIFV
ncbi:hypothetical protein M422DRAFT_244936 [Sphaerobolus stellatus SS14]|nr:hypothetical protein M422DRAFT_244936 [Sphaerobolus stellatus SS14]